MIAHSRSLLHFFTRGKAGWVFTLFFLVCLFEGYINRHNEFQTIINIQASSMIGVTGHYPHAFSYDNDLDNDNIHAEGFQLARQAYIMGGTFEDGQNPKLDLFYPPDKYRLYFPFLASFLLWFLKLKDAYQIINVLVWALTSYAIYWMGRCLFNSERTGIIAGLFFATCYAPIILLTSPKAEIFQLTAPIILVALSFFLDQYTDDLSLQAASNSLLLGLLSGVALFAGGSTTYFLVFLFTYGFLTTRFSIFIKRSIMFLVGFAPVYVLINGFVYQETYNTVSIASLFSMSPAGLWSCIRSKYVNHFPYIIPLHLWIGAAAGLYRVTRQQLKAIVCMFSMLVVSEVIMTAAQQLSCWDRTLYYYYLQILLPVFLLNARTLDYLLFSSSSMVKKSAVLAFFLVIKRSAAFVIIILTLLVSNLGLLGNYYFYYMGYRATPIEILRYSFFTYDNLSAYKQMPSVQSSNP